MSTLASAEFRSRSILSTRRVELAAIVVMLVWATLKYRAAHAGHFAVRDDPAFPSWWEWNDQGKYYTAAKAWAEGQLDPKLHWYFPGYALLGAALFWLMPGQPFYLVDLVCLLAFALAFVALAGRLAPEIRFIRAYAAIVFVLTVVLTRYNMKSFVEPWTTTPTAPISLAALVLTLRLWERPNARRGAGRAALAGLVAGSLVLFRPVDTAPILLAIAGTSAVAVGRPWRRGGKLALAGAAGVIVPIVACALLYLAVYGTQESLYLLQSSQTGFEWRLIPLRWITIFVSPRPAFPDDYSLSQTFPWIIPGVAGMVACLVTSRGAARLRHFLVIGALSLHCTLFLAYRDLQPPSLFRFSSYHYFKWCFPVFGLYAGLLLLQVARSRRRWMAWTAGSAVTAALFSLRVDYSPVAADYGVASGPHTLLLPAAPQSVMDAVFVPAEGLFQAIYLSSYEMHIGDRMFGANADFKAFPVPGGLLFTALRPMPAGPATVEFRAGVTLTGAAPELMRAHVLARWPDIIGVMAAYSQRWQKVDQ